VAGNTLTTVSETLDLQRLQAGGKTENLIRTKNKTRISEERAKEKEYEETTSTTPGRGQMTGLEPKTEPDGREKEGIGHGIKRSGKGPEMQKGWY